MLASKVTTRNNPNNKLTILCSSIHTNRVISSFLMDMSAEDVVWVVILLRIVPQILTLLMTHIKVKEFLNSNYGKETLILPLRNSLKTNIRYLEEL